MRRHAWTIALGAVLLLGLLLRLRGLHDPLLDHPGWRQGDTAAIARNFATLDFNPLHPQTDYDGPPPNYVELELQIVPFIAAALYKVFGIHEVFGRLITIAFSLATVAVLGFFGIGYLARTNPAVRYQLDALLLNLPWIGVILRKIILSRFASVFAMMYASGIT